MVSSKTLPKVVFIPTYANRYFQWPPYGNRTRVSPLQCRGSASELMAVTDCSQYQPTCGIEPQPYLPQPQSASGVEPHSWSGWDLNPRNQFYLNAFSLSHLTMSLKPCRYKYRQDKQKYLTCRRPELKLG